MAKELVAFDRFKPYLALSDPWYNSIMKFFWIRYREGNGPIQQTCVEARNKEKAGLVAQEWQKERERDGRMVFLLPRPAAPSVTPFVVADESILEKPEEPVEGTMVAIDFKGMATAKVLSGLEQGFLDPGSVYELEMDGDRRKGVLKHLREKYGQPPPPVEQPHEANI